MAGAVILAVVLADLALLVALVRRENLPDREARRTLRQRNEAAEAAAEERGRVSA